MQDQHEKITGYRDLSQVEIDLMNEIKAHGAATEALLDRVKNHLAKQAAIVPPAELQRVMLAQPERWAAMAKTNYQTAQMFLVRAVAQPTSF